MSLIHSHSSECSLSPLEWFQVLPTQTAVEKTNDVEYQSLTSLRNNAPVEFYIPESTDDYIDLKKSVAFPMEIRVQTEMKLHPLPIFSTVCGAM